MVSTIEPRKNHLSLLSAWESLRTSFDPDLQLVLVGSIGWESESIMRRLKPWLKRGGLHLLEDVPAQELRLLYRHARCVVCPSFYEGFDFSGVEAMRCGGVVLASDIPVHRDVYGAASEYFNPYSVEDLEQALAGLMSPDAAARRGRADRRRRARVAAVHARAHPAAVARVPRQAGSGAARCRSLTARSEGRRGGER